MSWKSIVAAVAAVVLVGVAVYLVGNPPGGTGRTTNGTQVGANGGDTGNGNDAGNGEGNKIMLFCGAGIRPGVKPVIDEFQEEYGIKVDASYAGSGQLFGMLTAHRKGDLYMPGAEHYVDQAINKGLADGETKRRVAFFIPVILVRKGNPKNITSLEDFTRENLRLGLGQPDACAIGKRTLKIFEKNGINYDNVKPNVVYHSSTVNELGVAVQMHTVDATIMWDANANNFTEEGDIVRIPPEQNIPSIIPIVRMSFAEHPKNAQKFIDFLTSERGEQIFQEHGYTTSLPGKGESEEKN